MPDVNIFRSGPADATVVLALHGLTGHGRRWESLAAYLPDARIVAPDLRGHGRSTWAPPWRFEQLVDDLVAVLAHETDQPVVVLGHSFGGATGLFLSHARPELVRALVLLDPAIALPGEAVLTAATEHVRSPDYADVEEARRQKRVEAWGEVAPRLLEAELAEHLVPTTDGRVGWRMSIPAVTAYYGELARDFVLPPGGLRTVLVQAMKVQPAYVRPELLDALRGHLGEQFTLHEFDCDHMVSFARPGEVAEIVRALL